MSTVFEGNKFNELASHKKGSLVRSQQVLQTPVVIGVAGVYEAGQFVKATGIKGDRIVIAPITAEADVAIGVIAYNFGRDATKTLAVDTLIEIVELVENEQILVEANGAIGIDTAVEVTANGKKVTASNGNNKVVGFTREISAADGDLIRVRTYKEV